MTKPECFAMQADAIHCFPQWIKWTFLKKYDPQGILA